MCETQLREIRTADKGDMPEHRTLLHCIAKLKLWTPLMVKELKCMELGSQRQGFSRVLLTINWKQLDCYPHRKAYCTAGLA